MKILVLGGRLTYESQRILEEGVKANIDIEFCPTDKIIINNLKGELEILVNEKDIRMYDLLLLRAVSSSIQEVTALARYCHKNHMKIIEERIVTEHNGDNKVLDLALYTQNNIPYPPTIFLKDIGMINLVNDSFTYPLIAKEINSSQGKGIYLINDFAELKKFAENNLDKKILFQKKLRKHAEDYRIFVVGNKALGIMKKVAKENEYRSNASQGGIVSSIKDSSMEELAIRAAEISHSEIAGVDIMFDDEQNPYVLEVNLAPQFQSFEKATGVNVAKEIIDYCYIKVNQ